MTYAELLQELLLIAGVEVDEEVKPVAGTLLAAMVFSAHYDELQSRQLQAIFDKLMGPDPYPFPEE